MASTSTLSSFSSKAITFGSKYLTPFTVTSTGTLAVNGQTAVYSTIAASVLFNAGSISSHKYYGVYFAAGGAISNDSVTAQISGAYGGIRITTDAGTVTNDGTVAGTNSYSTGVYIYSGLVDNSGAASVISAYYAGVELGYGAGTITNDGKITATGSYGSGVYVSFFDTDASSVVNTGLAATISGGAYGVNIGGAPGSVSNAGTIIGTKADGVYLQDGGVITNTGSLAHISGGVNGVLTTGGLATLINGGIINGGSVGVYGGDGITISNAAGAHISGGGTGIQLNFAPGTLLNNGIIAGTSTTGVYLGGGGLVVNEAAGALISGGVFGVQAFNYTATVVNAGSIIGNTDGVLLDDGGTVTNAGFIAGGHYAVTLGGTGASRLIVDPGALFTGSIAASGTLNVLELAAAPGTFTLAGLGGSVTGFETIAFDSGADWLLAGTSSGFAGETITGFALGDTLQLGGFTTSSDSFNAGTLSLIGNGSTVALDFTGDFSLGSFIVTDTAAGTQIELCYLRGTRILTPDGPRAVETLSIGDAVLTRYSGLQPVKWIGRQSYAARFLAPSPARYPVRIKAGALGENLPRRDLYVSPGHSMLVNGVLLLAKNLVNGVSITQHELPALVEYFAIELAGHDCVLAEGSWGESFADGPGLRNQFHNIAEYLAMAPDYVAPAEVSLCAPRPLAGAALDAALRPIVARAAAQVQPGALRGYIETVRRDGCIAGWAQDAANPELPVLLEIFAGDRLLGQALACGHRGDLAEAGLGRGHAAFSFTAPAEHLPLDQSSIRVARAGDAAEIFATHDGVRAA